MNPARISVSANNTYPYDRLLPSDQIWVTDREAGVKLRMGIEGLAAEPAIAVPSLLIDVASKVPNHLALGTPGLARTWTYHQYLLEVKKVAKGFIKIGLRPHGAVGILGFNAPEWNFSLLGSIFAGGISSGIYTTNSPEAVQFVLQDCEADIVVVENKEQLTKVLAVRDKIPSIKAIIQYTGDLGSNRPAGVHMWDEMVEAGRSVSDADLEARTRLCAPNKCCTLIYTSGTTGNPKAVMLSHDNMTWTSKSLARHNRFRWAKEVGVSFLPLSHIAAQLVDIFIAITVAGTMHFAQPNALKGSLVETLKEVRPTVFLAVPRVWEKISEKLREVGKQTKGCRKKIATWAKRNGLKGNIEMMNGRPPSLSFKVANRVVFTKVKGALGLERCANFFSGAAPISMDTLEYFMSLNIPITEVYGMSESSGLQHIGVPWDFKIGTVGPTIPGVRTELLDEDKDGNGEVCFYGRNVFMGYLHCPEKTKEIINDRGLLMSGDIGQWDETGHYMSITGRIKELIITAGGENVAPVPIEDNIKHELPIISNAMLIGDKRKFLSVLLTLRTNVDLDTMVPSDQLTPEAIDWVRSVGSSATTVSAIVEMTDPDVMRGIQAGVDRANQNAISRAQKVQKWTILPMDFSQPGGELGPTQKLKRKVADEIYSKTIETFYQVT